MCVWVLVSASTTRVWPNFGLYIQLGVFFAMKKTFLWQAVHQHQSSVTWKVLRMLILLTSRQQGNRIFAKSPGRLDGLRKAARLDLLRGGSLMTGYKTLTTCAALHLFLLILVITIRLAEEHFLWCKSTCPLRTRHQSLGNQSQSHWRPQQRRQRLRLSKTVAHGTYKTS